MMMNQFQPKCKKIPVDRLLVGPTGIVDPLCQSCINRHCGNPIEPMDISIMGITRKWWLYKSGNNVTAVIECEAYQKSLEE